MSRLGEGGRCPDGARAPRNASTPSPLDPIRGRSPPNPPEARDLPGCQARTTVTVASTPAEVCDVILAGADSLPATGATTPESAWLLVHGKQVGVCELDVTYLEGAGGAGQTAHLSVDVVEVQTPE